MPSATNTAMSTNSRFPIDLAAICVVASGYHHPATRILIPTVTLHAVPTSCRHRPRPDDRAACFLPPWRGFRRCLGGNAARRRTPAGGGGRGDLDDLRVPRDTL